MPGPDDFFSRRIVLAVPGMDGVPVRLGIPYKVADTGPLELDVYLPAALSAGERRPAVVFVHGDAPAEVLANAKDWGAFVSWGQLAAASGLVGVTFNHRSTDGRTRLPDAASDVDDLVAFIRARADELSIDPERLGMVVFSMGPPVALHGQLPDPSGFLRCIAVYYGGLDLVPLRGETPDGVPDEILEEFSPARALERSTGPLPAILLARAGREERPWLNAGIDRFAAAAMARGASVDLLNHPTGRHAFDLLDDDPRSRDIIARTVEFLRLRLLGEPRSEPQSRTEDLRRHLEDLETGTFEGADGRADRIALFRRGVELIDQVVRSVLEETNAAFLFGRGEVEHRAIDVDERGDAEASWLLSWPEQRRAANVRSGGSVEPVRVVAWFAAAFTHPHLRGSRVGSWPFQVVDAGDALRQKPIVRAIVEAELHERIFEGTRKIIPASADPSPDDGDEHRKIPTHGGV